VSTDPREEAIRLLEHHLERLGQAIGRLAAAAERAAESRPSRSDQRNPDGGLSVRIRRGAEPATRCTHPDSHELRLGTHEALAVAPALDCPCCGARLWISFPTAGELLERVTLDEAGGVPDLEVELKRRERQVLAVLYRARQPLRTGAIASLVWSDSSRTHDVRSVLYRLRRKLRGTPWAIPVWPGGQGVRLVRSDPRDELLAQAGRSAHAERAA
jgi:hypothetical protein